MGKPTEHTNHQEWAARLKDYVPDLICIVLDEDLNRPAADDNAEEERLTVFIIADLCDLDARLAYPAIRRAYAENNVLRLLGRADEAEAEYRHAGLTALKAGLRPADVVELAPPGMAPTPAGGGPKTTTRPTPPRSVPKVGRNEPCPCDSGKKYKHCYGRRNQVRKGRVTI